MNAAPLTPEPARQAILGGVMLAGIEADILGDDAVLRGLLTELRRVLEMYETASGQAVAVHLRLAAPPNDGYVEADRTEALANYNFARGLVLTAARDITDRVTDTTETNSRALPALVDGSTAGRSTTGWTAGYAPPRTRRKPPIGTASSACIGRSPVRRPPPSWNWLSVRPGCPDRRAGNHRSTRHTLGAGPGRGRRRPRPARHRNHHRRDTIMTETTTEQQAEPAPETTAQNRSVEEDTEETTATDDATRKARTDAAGYRRQLRDTEAERDNIAAERDALLERVTARQRADVESLAARRLADGTDVWQAVELTDVLDSAGDIDEAKVTAAVAGLVEAKPHYRVARVDLGFGPRATPAQPASGWGDVLRGR